MASPHITEDLLVENQGFRTDTDVDSDDTELSDEEGYSPEPEELIQGPSELIASGFVERGKQKADSSGVPAKDQKKNQKDVALPPITQHKTDKPPPKKEPKASNYK